MTKDPTYSQILRAARAKLNLSQDELAKKLGVSFASINRWEGGIYEPQRLAQDAIKNLARDIKLTKEEIHKSATAAVKRRTRSNLLDRRRPGLERALVIVEQYQSRRGLSSPVSTILDELAEQFAHEIERGPAD